MRIHNRKLHGKKFFFFFKRKIISNRLKNGKPLTPDLGFESQFDVKTGQITLKHKGATPKLVGELICRVENSAGTIDAPVTLDVQSRLIISFEILKKHSSSYF
jgi:hypothetical protein